MFADGVVPDEFRSPPCRSGLRKYLRARKDANNEHYLSVKMIGSRSLVCVREKTERSSE